jgi:hypothetical protein
VPSQKFMLKIQDSQNNHKILKYGSFFVKFLLLFYKNVWYSVLYITLLFNIVYYRDDVLYRLSTL